MQIRTSSQVFFVVINVVVFGFQLSKRRAAEKMLKLLETLPPPPRPAINNMDRKRYAKRLAYVKAHNRKVNGTVITKSYNFTY